MEMELHSSLSYFQASTAETWQPRILKTQATNNVGMDLLAKSISDHGAYLKSTGKLQGKILEQNRQRLIDALEAQILSRIVEEGFEKYGIAARIEDIALRRIDPYTVVDELLAKLKL